MPPSGGTRSRKGSETDPGVLSDDILTTVRKRTITKTKITPRSRSTDRKIIEASGITPKASVPGIVPNPGRNAEVRHSTPAGSPTANRTEFRSPFPRSKSPLDNLSGYGTTPMAESQGTKLISDVLPTIKEDSTVTEINDYLDKINEFVNNYEARLDDNPNWRAEVHSKYKTLVANISDARLIGTDKCNDALISRCSELLSKLESAKLKWSSKSISENSLYSFHGFPSFEDSRTNLTGGHRNPQMGSQVVRASDLTKRISELEKLSAITFNVRDKLPLINELLSKVNPNQVSGLLERVAIIEQKELKSKENRFNELDLQLSNLESRFNQLSNSYDSQKSVCNQAANAQRSLVRELTSFKLSMSNAIESLTATVEQYAYNSSTQTLHDIHPSTIQANYEISAPHSIETNINYLNQTNGLVYTTAGVPKTSTSVSSWLSSQPIFNKDYEQTKHVPQSYHSNDQESIAAAGPKPSVVMPGTNYYSNLPVSSNVRLSEKADDSLSFDKSDGTTSLLDLQGRLLRSQMKSLSSLLIPSLDKSIPKCTLEDIYKNRLIAIEIKERELAKSLKDYLRSSTYNVQLCEKITDVIEDAAKYASEVRAMYVQEGYHMKSQSAKLYEALPKFTSQSDMHIFEFLRRYDAVAKEFDIPSEKAELLYSKFLSPSIQEEIVRYKGDYKSMRKMLLQRYGNLKTITSNMLLPISKDQVPESGQDVLVHLSFYRKLQFAFQRINKLLTSPDVPAEEVQDYLFSNDFITHVLLYLPQEAENDFIRQLQRLDEDTIRIKGKTAFKVLLSTVNQFYEMFDTSARNKSISKSPSLKPKRDKDHSKKTPKQFNAVDCNVCSSGTDTDSDVDGGPSCSIHFQQNKQRKFNAPKPVSSYKFPCIIEGHNHSLGECEEFFQISPQQRFEHKKQFKFRYCILCLQSSDECKFKNCANTKLIPSILKCSDCKAVSKNGDKQVYSILFCFSERHSKPSNDVIIKALEEYVPKFKQIQYKSPINIACHLQILSASKIRPCTKPQTLTRAVDKDEPVPVFNTNSGLLESPVETDIIHEVNDDSIGIMQILNIHGMETLTLFDTGANNHLMDGALAEDLKIKVHTQEPTAIGVISGGQIWTEYGQYELALGPTRAGNFFQFLVQGISSVTGSIPNYDLKQVNEEVREHTDIDNETPLPDYVGGGKIKLLIGLKNAQIEPVCLFTLPSGLGVYRSPFTDIFGSNICFGGPHSSFSSANKMLSSNINHFNAFLLQTFNKYQNSFYPSLIRALEPELIEGEGNLMQFKEPDLTYSFQSSSGQKVYPTPLGANDFIELGQTVECEIDEGVCPGPHCDCSTITNAFKAKIPLSRQRDFIDEDDIESSEGFRCQKCARCRCNTNNRMKMMSLNEAVEQAAIEKSVTVDLEDKKVYVDLPFTKPPGEFLKARHGGDNNYKQAHRVYKSQCKVPELQKEGLRKVQQELVDKGFLKKLEDLPEEHQKLIENSEFKHYMPWRLYKRPESETTPVRVVVDPSQTGLNLILAKGENRLSKINDILTRARVRKHIWSSDISKLYNRLILRPTSYAYQLFLFSNDLDPDTPPEIYVMVVAWYGVSSSSNQSGFALEELARLLKTEYPRAYLVIMLDRYVDDILSGSDSKAEMEKQISEVVHVLSCGGFTTKFVIQSGQVEEGTDILKVLGYRWHIAEDKLSPGFKELNFNSKKRGMKGPNPFPVINSNDVTKLLSSKNISRRMVISKIAELWEPAGYFEPYKVQLKLAAHALNGLEWDSPIAMDLQEYWIVRFQEFLSIPNLRISRYIFPQESCSDGKIRLLCLSDAACAAGGAAVYAGVKLSDGSYSCQLLSSRSKLMNESVPRNELNAIRIGANLVFDIKNALGDMVSECLFFTDSNIAMAWCMNTKKRLRLYCLNRVTEIRNLLESITEVSGNLPIFHIDGLINIADLLTKPNNIKPEDISENSSWIQGYDWMKLDVKDMPVTTFSQLKLSSVQNECDKEYFPEVFLPSANSVLIGNTQEIMTHCTHCRYHAGLSVLVCFGTSNDNPHCVECDCNSGFYSFVACKAASGSPMLIDMVKIGYQKSINVMARVLDFVSNLYHKVHLSRGILNSQTCKRCVGIAECGGIEFEYSKVLRRAALNVFLRKEASNITATLSSSKLKEFTLKDGIYYATGRIADDAKVTIKDLDHTVFFDNLDIKGVLPVVSADSPLFFAFLIHIHHKVRKHSGNSITLREIMKSMFVLNNPMRIVQAVRKNCPRCRLLIRKTQELEMANHPQSRMQIAPPFYHVMIDIVYGFKGKIFKRSRTEVKIYGLVIVCLMTSATNILALEGIEAQDVVQALERHSSRYGIPAAMFVDQGTQLTCLEGIKLDLRNIHAQLRESVGIEVYPSAPKSHQSQGRVERKILTLREMLKKTAVNTDIGMTALQWETIFSKMANEIDEIPIARTDKSTYNDLGWELLTPNRCKLGRSNQRALQGPIYLTEKTTPMDIMKRAEEIQRYWFQLLLDRLHHLIPRPSKWRSTDLVQENDIVLFRFLDNQSSKLETWKLGRIEKVLKEGRRVSIAYVIVSNNGKKATTHTVERSPRDVCVISAVSELNLNSSEFFDKVKKIV